MMHLYEAKVFVWAERPEFALEALHRHLNPEIDLGFPYIITPSAPVVDTGQRKEAS